MLTQLFFGEFCTPIALNEDFRTARLRGPKVKDLVAKNRNQ